MPRSPFTRARDFTTLSACNEGRWIGIRNFFGVEDIFFLFLFCGRMCGEERGNVDEAMYIV